MSTALPQRRPRPDNRTRAFELALVKGKHVPRLRCDGCHELIADGSAKVVFHAVDFEPTGPWLFLHKICPDGKRRDIAREKRFTEQGAWLWQDLGAFLWILLHNSGYAPEEVEFNAELLERSWE